MSSKKPKKQQQQSKKNKSKQQKGLQLWARIAIVVLVIAALFFISYAHLIPLLFASEDRLPANYALNLKILNDVEPAEDEERNYINVDDENKCVDMSYAVQRDNTRSWMLFQGGLPSELGVKYILSSETQTSTGEQWTPVTMSMSNIRTSVDFSACALENGGQLKDTLLVATAAAKVATFFGVLEESGGTTEIVLNAPPQVTFDLPSVVTPTFSFTVTATDGPYSKPTKITVSALIPQPNGTYLENNLYTTPEDKKYDGPVTVSAHLEPGNYVIQVAASDNMYNVRTVTKEISVK